MPDYDDGLVTAVAKALAEVPIHSTSRLYLDRSDANDAARAAIAAVLEWHAERDMKMVKFVTMERPSFVLDDLLEGMTPENRHEEI